LKNNQGFVFSIVILTIVFIIGLSAAFFMRGTSEKRLVDREKYTMQASFLAEAGAHHGLSELRQRIRTDLSSNVNSIRNASTIRRYYSEGEIGDPLGFLVAYGNAGGNHQNAERRNPQFEIPESNENIAILELSPLSIQTDIDGEYDLELIISAQTDPDPNYPGTNPTNPGENVYVFYYNYAAKGIGKSTAATPNIEKNVYLIGSFSVTARQDDFAKYALFTNHHRSGPSGGPVWFSERTDFDGPVHTNDRFSFAYNPSASFTHEVTQHQNRARFYNDGEPILLNADRNGELDVPKFDVSFQRGAAQVNLESAVDSNNLKAQALGTMRREPRRRGVYVPMDNSDNVTGGIYIRGDASGLVMATTKFGPQYTITQGGNTTVIAVDYTADQTSVTKNGILTATGKGIPNGVDDEGIIIYSRDDVENVRGIVNSQTTMTLAAKKDIVISGDLQYESYIDKPLSTDATNMLGLISCNGDVRIGTNAPDNVSVHGIVVAPHGVFTVDDYNKGVPRGTATLLGGVISDYYGIFGTSHKEESRTGYGRNFVYDSRVLAGKIPPFFPKTRNFVTIEEGLSTRPMWKNVVTGD